MAGTRASSLARLAAATSRENQLREFGCYLLQWQEDMHSLFADFRAELRGSLHSVAPNKNELMCEESKFDQESSSIFGGNKGTEANSAGPRVLDAPIEADRISGAALADGDIVRNLALPDLDANSLHQKVESNLVEAKTKIDSGGLVENPAQDDISVDSTQEIVPCKIVQVGVGLFLDAHNLLEEMSMGDGSAKLQEMGDFEPLKVTSFPLLEASGCDYENKSQLVVDLVESTRITLSDVKMSSTEILGIHSAHKLFDELPMRKTEVNGMNLSSTVVYLGIKIMVDGSCLIVVDNMGLVFDPGGVVDHGRSRFDSSYAAGWVHIWSELVWVFDPGGGLTSIGLCAAAFC